MKGSHKCGRIEHSMVAGQTAADINRVRELKKKLELVYVELEPGILNYIVHIQLLTRLKFSNSYQQLKISKHFRFDYSFIYQCNVSIETYDFYLT